MPTQKGKKMPSAPNMKNSKLRLNGSINVTDQISVGFWFNIDDQDLVNQLEKYYAIANKSPSIQLQRKEIDTYSTMGSANLFLPDEKKAMFQSSSTPIGDDDGFPGR